MELEKLSIHELEAILEEEKAKGTELINKIKTKMLKISAEMKRYNISTAPLSISLNYNQNIKQQLIAKIRAARQYNMKLSVQWNEIRNLSGLEALHKILISYDNVDTSKQVEILRNLGYSEAEIDIILAEIRGDEEYDELKEKAADIIVNHYLGNEEEVDEDDVGINPYL